MVTGNPKAWGAALLLVAIAAAGCGSDDGTPAQAALSSDTAEALAQKSDEVAAALDAGDTCEAARKADDLRIAVSEAEIPDELRPEVDAGAEQLVNEVKCEDEEKQKEEKHGGDEGGDGDEDESSGEGSSGPPGHGGSLPPGQARKLEEDE